MKFKDGILPVNDNERLAYLYKFQETIISDHNSKGKNFIDGLISEKEFRDYQNGWFKRASELTCIEICKSRDNLRSDATTVASTSDINNDLSFTTGVLPLDLKDRVKYLYRLKEVLALEKTNKIEDFNTGDVSELELKTYLNDEFINKDMLIDRYILECKSSFKVDKDIIASLDDVEE